jgi:predicted Zn-dependent protease
MRKTAMTILMLALAAPATAQLGGIGGALRNAQRAQEKLDGLTFSDQEERQIGEEVSTKVRARFGVVQDAAVHKYLTLVGMTVAQQSSRPQLAWTFIVLDTDGVNAFAAPGGFVHITRGALALIDSEAELAAVLGHEIGHITQKHTINAIRKSNAVRLGTEAAASRSAIVSQVASAAYSNVLENAYDRGDENDADRLSVELTQKAGYRAGTLGDFLMRLAERNKTTSARNGLFASHPETKDRMARIAQLSKASRTTALAQTRFTTNIVYQPVPLAEIPVADEGAAGLAGGEKKAPEKKEEPKKGLGLGALKNAVTQEKPTAQVAASGGARGVGEDRHAKGGSNPALVKVSVTSAEVDAFRKAIA